MMCHLSDSDDYPEVTRRGVTQETLAFTKREVCHSMRGHYLKSSSSKHSNSLLFISEVSIAQHKPDCLLSITQSPPGML